MRFKGVFFFFPFPLRRSPRRRSRRLISHQAPDVLKANAGGTKSAAAVAFRRVIRWQKSTFKSRKRRSRRRPHVVVRSRRIASSEKAPGTKTSRRRSIEM